MYPPALRGRQNRFWGLRESDQSKLLTSCLRSRCGAGWWPWKRSTRKQHKALR
nr:MAG TPA: hypothetical protein [Caudoviricetes sp.]